jgi:hypothetical protein
MRITGISTAGIAGRSWMVGIGDSNGVGIFGACAGMRITGASRGGSVLRSGSAGICCNIGFGIFGVSIGSALNSTEEGILTSDGARRSIIGGKSTGGGWTSFTSAGASIFCTGAGRGTGSGFATGAGAGLRCGTAATESLSRCRSSRDKPRGITTLSEPEHRAALARAADRCAEKHDRDRMQQHRKHDELREARLRDGLLARRPARGHGQVARAQRRPVVADGAIGERYHGGYYR